MAIPTSRNEFKDYIKRKLGFPVILIEISPDQLDDCIDDALLKYRDYHFDGSEHCWYKILVTQTDIDNEYFSIPDEFVGITRIMRLGSSHNISNLFNIRYQIHLNDLFDYSAATFTPYVMAMRHIETLEEIFVGDVPIRYNRHKNRLYCDLNWSADVPVGTWVVAEGYKLIDPEEYTDVWNDQWLKKYATALAKRQWGNNLKKHQGTPLPGNAIFNGQVIYDEAVEELKELDADVVNSYSLPVHDMTG